MSAKNTVQSMDWELSELLDGIYDVAPPCNVKILGLALDSRKVQPGDLFFALPGTETHGLEFVQDAITRGAVAVVCDAGKGVVLPANLHSVPIFAVNALVKKVGVIADRFHFSPSKEMTVIAVTGTDGKTSTSHFIAQALGDDRHECGVIGTLGYGLFGHLAAGVHTTPDAVTLQAELKVLGAAGADHVVMEASSHALAQYRLNGVAIDLAVLTNLSRDHLDYHGTIEAYTQAKRRLFSVPGLRHAILNIDDSFGQALYRELDGMINVAGYTLGSQSGFDAFVAATCIECLAEGLIIEVETPMGKGRFKTPLLGRFNASNLLATLAVLLVQGVSFDEALLRLEGIKTVPGRMEAFGGDGKPLVVVDFAHTPAALKHALLALREHCHGRLWCIFGCGGDRDRGKRALMGKVAEDHADYITITSDNPRSEYPEIITSDILKGMSRLENAWLVQDRAEAIGHVVRSARPADVILIAGKGHETEQIIGDHHYHFSDREQVTARLTEWEAP